MSVRKVRRDGNSLAVTLGAVERGALGVAAGDCLRAVVTSEGTVEFQPLTPPSPAAAERARAAAGARAHGDEMRRLRRRARRAYEAGYNRGYAQGFAKAGTDLLLELGVRAAELRELVRALGRGGGPARRRGRWWVSGPWSGGAPGVPRAPLMRRRASRALGVGRASPGPSP